MAPSIRKGASIWAPLTNSKSPGAGPQQRDADAKADLPRVKLTTNKGDIVLEVFEDQLPDTGGNFINLVEEVIHEPDIPPSSPRFYGAGR